MSLDLEILKLLPRTQVLEFRVTVGELADALARQDAAPAPAKRRLTVSDVAAMRGCSLTTARTLFPLIPCSVKGNGRDWECTPEQYAQFEAGLSTGAIRLPSRKKRGLSVSPRRERPSLSAYRDEQPAPAPQRRAGGGR